MAIIAQDNFDRANSTTTLGSTPVGGFVWQKYGTQQWGIQNNQAYPITFNYDHPTYIDVAVADQIAIQFQHAVYHSSSQFFYRVESDGNGFLVESPGIYKYVNGTYTEMGRFAMVNGDTVRIELRGSQHTVFVNSVQVLQFNDATFSTGTKLGFSTNSSMSRFDNILVETFTATPPVNAPLYKTEDFMDNTYEFPMTQGTMPWTRLSTAAPNGNLGYMTTTNTTDATNSVVSFSVVVPAGATNAKLEVDWYCDTEQGYDMFKILLNGTMVLSESGLGRSGTYISTILPAGTHTFQFRYEKDVGTNSGLDKAYLTEMRLYATLAGGTPTPTRIAMLKTQTGELIPIYNIAGFETEAFRQMTADGKGFIYLVPVTDPNASRIRQMTTKGLRAWKK